MSCVYTFMHFFPKVFTARYEWRDEYIHAYFIDAPPQAWRAQHAASLRPLPLEVDALRPLEVDALTGSLSNLARLSWRET